MLKSFKLSYLTKISGVAFGILLGQTISSNILYAQALIANGGPIVVTGPMDVSVDGETALLAINNGLIDIKNAMGTITITGDGVYGLRSDTGGRIDVGTYEITTSGFASHAAYSTGANSQLNFYNSTFHVAGQQANGVLFEDGAQVNLQDVTITTDGWSGIGVSGRGLGSSVVISGSIVTNGSQSAAVVIDNNAIAQISNLTILTTDINASDEGTYQGLSFGLHANNNGSIVATSTQITTQGKKGVGILATNGGKNTVTNSSITTSGDDAYALMANNVGSIVDADGMTINTTGEQSVGVNAVNGGFVTLTNSTVVTTGGTSHGIYIHNINDNETVGSDASAQARHVNITTSGTQAIGILVETVGLSKITADNIIINTIGDLSHGVRVIGGVANLDTILINSTGKQSYGLWSSGANASIYGNNIEAVSSGWHSYGAYVDDNAKITLSNATIETNNYDTAGLYAASGGVLTADNSQITVKGYLSSAISTINGGSSSITASSLTTTEHDSPVIFMHSDNGEENTVLIDKSELHSSNSITANIDQGVANLTIQNSTVTDNNGRWLSVGESTGTIVADATITLNNTNVLGSTQTYLNSQSHLTIANNSVWSITGNSNLTSLVNDNSTIRFNYNNSTENNNNGFVRLNISGDYHGTNGQIIFNTILGNDNSPTDYISIGGNTSGSTIVSIVNRGGLGALTTGNGIEIISVGGVSAANAFALKGDYVFEGRAAVVGGAYSYSLYHNGVGGDTNDGNWYLRSLTTETPPVNPTDPTNPVNPEVPTNPEFPTVPSNPVYQPGVALYEVYPQVLQQMNKLGTLEQRVGNRTWLGQHENGVDVASITEGRGFWMKVEGSTSHINSNKSKTNANYDLNIVKTQLGLDFEALDNDKGTLIGGVYFQYGHAKADISSRFGKGDIKTDGYGLGGTLTWYGNNGLYVDGVAQAMWYKSDINSDTLDRREADGNKGTGYALSIEAGKKIALNQEWTLTPQAQLSYNSVDFDSFRDAYKARVSREDGDALTGRLGVSLDRETAWKSAAGDMRRLKAYGIANLYYEFLDGTQVQVTGVKFRNQPDRFWGGLGAGLSHNWNDDKYSIYGEVDARSSFNDFGDSYSLNGTVGFRAKF